MVATVASIKSAGQAGHYYGQTDDYYRGSDMAPTCWHGKGADALGLAGKEVDARTFTEALSGKLPDGTQLGRADGKGGIEHRPGWDVTFSAPKSVSVAALAAGDDRVTAAHDRAVATALAHIERHGATARDKGLERAGQAHSTDNLLIATFRHTSSREGQPQLHTHSVVMNATRDEAGNWRSIESKSILRLQKEAGELYRLELARELRAAGYQLETGRDKNGQFTFEVANIDKDLMRHWSARSEQVEKALEARGKDRDSATAAEKQTAALDSRKSKENHDQATLRASWQAEAREHGTDLGKVVADARTAEQLPELRDAAGQEAADRAVKDAAAHLSERDARFTEHDLIREAHRFGNAQASLTEIRVAVDRAQAAGDLVARDAKGFDVRTGRNGEAAGFTTREAIATERDMLAIAARAAATPLPTTEKEQENELRRNDYSNLDQQRLRDGRAAAVRLAADRDATDGRAPGDLSGVRNLSECGLVQNEKAAGVLLQVDESHRLGQGRAADSEMRREGTGADEAGSAAGRLERHPDALATRDDALAAIARQEARTGFEFNPAQRATTVGILTGGDRVHLVQGYAGTAKTTSVLAAASSELRRQGYEIKALAPMHSAKNTLAEAIGAQSQTVAAHLNERSTGGSKQVWMVDEAGMLSARDMRDLLAKAEREQARVVLVGDVKQLASVAAGNAFKQLQEHSELKTHVLDEIVRQKNEAARGAVEASIKGDAREALNKIEQCGKVQEIRHRGEREEALVRDYMKQTAEQREKSLVVVQGRAERESVNEKIREAMKERGELKGEAAKVSTLEKRDLTAVEQSKAASYRPGDELRFSSDLKSQGIKKDEYARVVKTDAERNRLTIETRNGKQIELNPAQVKRFEAFERKEREIQAGERLTITRNEKIAQNGSAKAEQRHNGDRLTVERVDGSKLHCRDEKGRPVTLDTSKDRDQHFGHSYCQTAHAAQGKTCQSVYALQDSQRANLTNQQSFYVQISRATDRVHIYTDSKEKLAQQLERETGEKATALRDPKHEQQKDASKDVKHEQQREQGKDAGREVERENDLDRAADAIDKGQEIGDALQDAQELTRDDVGRDADFEAAMHDLGREAGTEIAPEPEAAPEPVLDLDDGYGLER